MLEGDERVNLDSIRRNSRPRERVGLRRARALAEASPICQEQVAISHQRFKRCPRAALLSGGVPQSSVARVSPSSSELRSDTKVSIYPVRVRRHYASGISRWFRSSCSTSGWEHSDVLGNLLSKGWLLALGGSVG